MKDRRNKAIWFLTGSQHLYGDKTLEKVAVHSRQISADYRYQQVTTKNAVMDDQRFRQQMYVDGQNGRQVEIASKAAGALSWGFRFFRSQKFGIFLILVD